jgi:sugar (pentulose or hexulose) kinase
MAIDGPLFLGVDVGTGGVRVLAVSEAGEVAARADAAFDLPAGSAEGDRHEQPPAAWWGAVCRATRQLVDELHAAGGDPARLAAVAIDGTSGTLVAVDGAGEPLRPALLYNDGRAGAEAAALNEAAGSFCEKLGYRFAASYALAKIAWLSRHEPDTFARAARFLHQADFIQERLTGQPAVSDYFDCVCQV